MQKQWIINLIFIFCAAFTITAQQKKVVTITAFSKIKVFDGISVLLIKAKQDKVVLSGESPDKMVLLSKNGLLKIRMKFKDSFKGHINKAVVYHSKPLSVIDANEGAIIDVKDPIKQVDITLKAQEGSSLKARLEVDHALIKVASGATIQTLGKAKNQEVDIHTGATYQGKELQTKQTKIKVTAGGKANIRAKDYVNAKVKAGGRIFIEGNPKVIDKQVFLKGEIHD